MAHFYFIAPRESPLVSRDIDLSKKKVECPYNPTLLITLYVRAHTNDATILMVKTPFLNYLHIIQ